MGLISIVSNALRGQFDPISAVAYMLSALMVIFLVSPFHEFSHALVAHKLGDDTAKWQGRLSLNPMRHIDWIGAALIMAVGFGWANPVPVNPRNFKNPKGGMALVALAGPVSNLLAALLSMFLFYLIAFIFTLFNASSKIAVLALYIIRYFFIYLTQINISLAVFNLIPVPPLDGSRLLTALLPDRVYYKIMAYERYISLALVALLIFGVFDYPISYLTRVIFNAFNTLAALPFGG